MKAHYIPEVKGCCIVEPVPGFMIELETDSSPISTNGVSGYFALLQEGQKKYWRFAVKTFPKGMSWISQISMFVEAAQRLEGRDRNINIVSCMVDQRLAPQECTDINRLGMAYVF